MEVQSLSLGKHSQDTVPKVDAAALQEVIMFYSLTVASKEQYKEEVWVSGCNNLIDFK